MSSRTRPSGEETGSDELVMNPRTVRYGACCRSELPKGASSCATVVELTVLQAGQDYRVHGSQEKWPGFAEWPRGVDAAAGPLGPQLARWRADAAETHSLEQIFPL